MSPHWWLSSTRECAELFVVALHCFETDTWHTWEPNRRKIVKMWPCGTWWQCKVTKIRRTICQGQQELKNQNAPLRGCLNVGVANLNVLNGIFEAQIVSLRTNIAHYRMGWATGRHCSAFPSLFVTEFANSNIACAPSVDFLVAILSSIEPVHL